MESRSTVRTSRLRLAHLAAAGPVLIDPDDAVMDQVFRIGKRTPAPGQLTFEPGGILREPQGETIHAGMIARPRVDRHCKSAFPSRRRTIFQDG